MPAECHPRRAAFKAERTASTSVESERLRPRSSLWHRASDAGRHPAMRLRFTKMHGIGNDYVYVDCFAHRVADPARARARGVSPRRTGIGSDGLILICPSDDRRLPHGDVQRRRQPRRDVRQRHPLRRQVRRTSTACARQADAARRDRRRRQDARSSTSRDGTRRARHRRHGRADPRRPAHPGRAPRAA